MPVTLNDLTADGLNSVEPQRGNNAKLHILGLSSLGGSDTFGSDVLVLAAQSFPVPKTNSGTLELSHLNEKRKFAGLPIFETISVVYKSLLLVSTPVYEILYGWRQLVHNVETGVIGFQSDYKKNGYVVQFDSKGTNQRTYPIYGMWPQALDGGEHDSEDEGNVRINLTLEIDKFVYSNSAAIPSAWSAAGYP